jgi:hypothetical protein
MDEKLRQGIQESLTAVEIFFHRTLCLKLR